MKTLGLIPARGGSKGILRKNVRQIAGKPLIAWTIEAALASPQLDAVLVSTDDDEIAEVARHAGALVPFMRPPHLATDEAPGIAPVLHALREMPEYEAVLLLQPTSPMRTPDDIEGLLTYAAKTNAPSVVSVCEPDSHPRWIYTLESDQTLKPLFDKDATARRQDLPPVFTLNGAMYFAQTRWLQRRRTFIGTETLGYVMPAERSIDIDTPLDWRIAEFLLADREGCSR